ncbi:MAG: hypothetical protein DLM70_12685 [Chloroflexi bacterium]|nr:MAG: hypothetical protein DLM70_12685 [Chloroflexota bacterium]
MWSKNLKPNELLSALKSMTLLLPQTIDDAYRALEQMGFVAGENAHQAMSLGCLGVGGKGRSGTVTSFEFSVGAHLALFRHMPEYILRLR